MRNSVLIPLWENGGLGRITSPYRLLKKQFYQDDNLCKNQMSSPPLTSEMSMSDRPEDSSPRVPKSVGPDENMHLSLLSPSGPRLRNYTKEKKTSRWGWTNFSLLWISSLTSLTRSALHKSEYGKAFQQYSEMVKISVGFQEKESWVKAASLRSLQLRFAWTRV